MRRARLTLELLEDRSLPSRFDGSFDAVGLTALRADPNYQGIDGSGIGIAILDSGVYARNPDLQGNFVHWYDAVQRRDGGDVAGSVNAAFDPEGHGTHVAGIAASSNPDLGVAPAARLIGVRALPAAGEALPSSRDPLLDALQWVLAHVQDYNIRVVNMSLGVPDTNINQELQRTQGEAYLIDQLERLGVTVISAAGNDYADFAAPGATVPAAYSTLSVANTWAQNGQYQGVVANGSSASGYWATTRDFHVDQFAASSQRSSLSNQVAAPGQQILSTWNGTDGRLTNTLSGTSMATPLVSGVVALMQDAALTYGGRALTPIEVRNLLVSSADTIVDSDVATNGRAPFRNGSVDFDSEISLPETGLAFHRVNAYRAIQATRQYITGAPAPTPIPQVGDTNAIINTAISLPNLDGNRVFTTSGFIGRDGVTPVGVNDVDLYRIVLNSPGTVTFQVTPVAGGTIFDPFLRLFDSTGRQIARVDDTVGNYPTLASQRLAAGTYYFGISSFANSRYNITTGTGANGGQSQGDYGLIVTLINPDPNGIITGAQPFAGLPEAFGGVLDSDPPPIGSDQRINVGSKDVDMFEVVAPDDGQLIVNVDAATVADYGGLTRNGGSAVDSYLRVFNEQGQQIAVNDDDGQTTDSFLRLNVPLGQRLFVAVSDFENQTYDPADPYTRSNRGTGGLYNLSLTFDNGDRDGTLTSAQAATVGATIAGVVGSDNGPTIGRSGAKDVDFYRFTPSSSGLLDVTATGLDGFQASLSVWAVGADGATVQRLAETTAGTAELIFRVQAGQTYHVAITGRGNSDFNSFSPASGSGGQTGRYELRSTLRPLSDLALLSDNQINGAMVLRTLQLGELVNDVIGRDGSLITGAEDVDLFRFVAPKTMLLQIRTETTAEGSSNTFLRFFDAAGQELAFNNDAGAQTTGSLIQIAVTAGQTYYIGVNGSSAQARAYNPFTGTGAAAGSQGSYVLLVSELEKNDKRLFVSGLYHDLLGRSVDPDALAHFERSLDEVRTPALQQIATEYVASPESRANAIRQFYERTLKRAPLAQETVYWLQALYLGATPEQVQAQIASSAEYIQQQGGPLPAWLDQLYRDLLGRERDPDDQTFLTALADGSTPEQVALVILQSDEYHARYLQELYTTFLGRDPESSERDYWGSVLRQLTPQPDNPARPSEMVAGAILASPEYLLRGGNTVPDWLTSLYNNLLHRPADEGGYRTTLERALGAFANRRRDIADVVLGSTEYREKLIQQTYTRYLERDATADDLAFWQATFSQGEGYQLLLATVLASDEFFARHGTTNDTWLDTIYQALLGRDRATNDTFFLGALTDGGATRQQVVTTILESAEYRTALIREVYESYMGRAATDGDVAYWLAVLQQQRPEQMLAALLSSAEYYLRPHTYP